MNPDDGPMRTQQSVGVKDLGRAFASKRVADWQAASYRDVCTHPLFPEADRVCRRLEEVLQCRSLCGQLTWDKASNQLHEQESTKQRLVGHERQRNKVLVEAKQAEEKPRWLLNPEVCLHKYLARTRQHAASMPRHA